MKKIIALLLTITSANTFAFTGEGFRIVSQKFTQTNGFNGGMVQIEAPVQVKKATPLAIGHDSAGKVNEHIELQSHHGVDLVNTTERTMRYGYTYRLYCDGAEFKFDMMIDIEKDGEFHEKALVYGSIQRQKPMNQIIFATTQISINEESIARSNANLKITK